MIRVPYLALAVVGVAACSGGAAPVQNSVLNGDCGVTPAVGAQHESESCGNASAMCLSGTAQTTGYVAAPISMRASLYRIFPSAPADGGGCAAPPIATQIVARDGTWAFRSDAQGRALDAWQHYYVEVVPAFSAQQTRAVSTRVGPLALPRSSDAAPIAIQVTPVQLDLLEQSPPDVPTTVRWATARLFDPQTGDEIRAGASVSLVIGSTLAQLAWGSIGGGSAVYVVQFPPPLPAAQPSYQMTTTLTGATPSRWTLIADPPAFAGTIATPPSGPVPVGQPLTVTWPVQSEADYEIVELFVTGATTGSWTKVYGSPKLVAPDASSETIPASALPKAGRYLLNVAFIKSNCPATAGGCVQAGSVANELLDAR